MRRCFFILALWLWAGSGAAWAAWQDELTTKPGKFAPLRSVSGKFKFGWALVPAAEADFAVTPEKGGVTKFDVSAHTIGAVRLTWALDATHTAHMTTTSLRPIDFRQSETYRKERISTRVDFTDQGVSRLRESQPPDANPPKTKKFDFPGVLDFHSALHFIRSQAMKPGDVYKIVVYASATPYLAQVTVAGRTRVRAAGKTYPAIKLDLNLWRIKSDLTLASHDKVKRCSVFLSDDADRLLLRIESELFVGQVWAELVRADFK